METVRLRVDVTITVQESDSSTGEASVFGVPPLHLSLTTETLSSVFASRDYQMDSGAAGEEIQNVLAWNLLSTQSAAPDADMAELQLAG
jgi:hypothetical protein